MDENFDSVLLNIGKSYESEILPDSRYYFEVDIGKHGQKLGLPDVCEKYKSINAIVPVKKPTGAMRVRIDGRTFVNYVQFETGVAVPAYVAENSGRSRRDYIPQDSMILGFE